MTKLYEVWFWDNDVRSYVTANGCLFRRKEDAVEEIKRRAKESGDDRFKIRTYVTLSFNEEFVDVVIVE